MERLISNKAISLLAKFSLALTAIVVLNSCDDNGAAGGDGKMDEMLDSVAYVVGGNIGKQFHQDSLKIDSDMFMQGFRAALNGDSLLISDSVAQGLMMRFQEFMQGEQQKKMEALMENKLKEGQEFLEKNKAEEGVQVTGSGLQYKVLNEGTGQKPDSNDKVKVHYTGKLIDGTVFDSSIERGEPTEFAVNRVIPGWTEGLQLMSQGSKYMFYIPSEIAYGPRGAGQNIGPNETLIFEVELLEVTKQ